jgi:hypothetical protein
MTVYPIVTNNKETREKVILHTVTKKEMVLNATAKKKGRLRRKYIHVVYKVVVDEGYRHNQFCYIESNRHQRAYSQLILKQ